MKTMKFLLVIAAVSFASVIFASEHPDKKSFTVSISVEKAMNCKALCSEMIKHLNPEFLFKEKKQLYFTTIRFRNITYVIYGKHNEWVSFFNMKKWKQAKPAFGTRAFSTN